MGGPHALWNMTAICSGHHVARHEGLLEITGRAPMIKVKWVVPTLAEDGQMREALLEREIDGIVNRTCYVPRGTSNTTISSPVIDGADSTADPDVRDRLDLGDGVDGLERLGDDVPRGTCKLNSP